MKLNTMCPPVLLGGLLAALAGCSSAASSRTPIYTQAEIGQAISQQSGEILSVRDVIITPNSTVGRGAQGAGSRIGGAAVVGAITGSPLAIASAVGSVVGEAGGTKLDNVRGEEITVQLRDGQVVTVVQERSDPPMAPGERIVVVTTGSSANLQRVRVTRTDILGDPVPLAKAP
jgi:outer membrane lipoprotein SlyB